MNIGYKLYEDLRDTQPNEFEHLQLEMALTCEANGWCMEDGYDEDGKRYLIINPPYVPSLDELKQSKILQLKSERDTIQELPIEYNGKFFDYNKESIQKLNEAKDCLEDTEDKQIWICADNTLTYLTYEDIMAIKRLGKERSNDAHIQYAKLKYIIEQSETEQEVDIITFDIDTSAIVLEV